MENYKWKCEACLYSHKPCYFEGVFYDGTPPNYCPRDGVEDSKWELIE